MFFDPEDQTFAIWDHKLTAEEALRESDRIRRKGLPAFTVEQLSRHKAEEAEDCGDCPTDVEHAINAIPGEKCNEWISLAFIKLGIDRPEAVIDRAFVENHALVPKTAN